MPFLALKATWTVFGGIIPGDRKMQPELSRQWIYTSEDYAADCQATIGETPGPHPEKPPTIFMQRRQEAMNYWSGLNDPARHNWAELTFTWM